MYSCICYCTCAPLDNSPSSGETVASWPPYWVLPSEIFPHEMSQRKKATCAKSGFLGGSTVQSDRVRRLRSMRWQRDDADAVSLPLALLFNYQRYLSTHFGSSQLRLLDSLNSPSSFVGYRQVVQTWADALFLPPRRHWPLKQYDGS